MKIVVEHGCFLALLHPLIVREATFSSPYHPPPSASNSRPLLHTYHTHSEPEECQLQVSSGDELEFKSSPLVVTLQRMTRISADLQPASDPDGCIHQAPTVVGPPCLVEDIHNYCRGLPTVAQLLIPREVSAQLEERRGADDLHRPSSLRRYIAYIGHHLALFLLAFSTPFALYCSGVR